MPKKSENIPEQQLAEIRVAYSTLKNVIESICPITESDWQQLETNSVIKRYKKNEVLLQTNTRSSHVWFVAQGLVRNFYTTEAGKEFNKSFIASPSFFGSMLAIVNNEASRFTIEALEDTLCVAISIDWFRKVSQSNVVFKTLALILAQQLAIKKEQREAELLLDDASTRYLNFIEESPSLERRIPAYHIASYLGITEVALSRTKAKLKS